MEGRTAQPPEQLHFSKLGRVEGILLWACIMEARIQSNSQQVIWKDVSIIIWPFEGCVYYGFRIVLVEGFSLC